MLALLICTTGLYAQKAMYTTQEEVATAAIAALDSIVQLPDNQKKLAKENIRGNYTFQITVAEKSRIVSMRFMEKSEQGTIHGQNYLNRYVKELKLGFKVPKGNYYKFDYTFKL